MKRIKKYSALLSAIHAADPKTRIAILRHAPDEFIKTLLEVVLNFLAGNIPHSPSTLQKLKRYKTHLREIEQKRRNNVKTVRQKMIYQKGGFLPLLIAPLIARLAAPAIAGAVTRNALDAVENRVKSYLK